MNSGICDLINNYIHIGPLTAGIICKHGLICKTKYIKYADIGLRYSCYYGNMKIAKLMIEKGADDWNWGLRAACEGGHLELAKLMINPFSTVGITESNVNPSSMEVFVEGKNKGADDWNWGLHGACSGGHLELAKLMINPFSMGVFVEGKNKGADNWNWGLNGACFGGYLEIVNLMIEGFAKNTNNWNWGLHGACSGGHLEIVKLMIEKGADDWNWGLSAACEGGHVEIANIMIEKGAIKCYQCSNSKHKF